MRRLFADLIVRAALVAGAAGLAFHSACASTESPQPKTAAETSAPQEATPPQAPSRATQTGASTDPTFQQAQVATDPTFTEARGSILPGVPEFPSFPSARLVGSAIQGRSQGRAGAAATQRPEGYRIKWTTSEKVPVVMQWYLSRLKADGWTLGERDDGSPEVEQMVRISRGDLLGYVAAEATGEGTEIVVSLKNASRQR